MDAHDPWAWAAVTLAAIVWLVSVSTVPSSPRRVAGHVSTGLALVVAALLLTRGRPPSDAILGAAAQGAAPDAVAPSAKTGD